MYDRELGDNFGYGAVSPARPFLFSLSVQIENFGDAGKRKEEKGRGPGRRVREGGGPGSGRSGGSVRDFLFSGGAGALRGLRGSTADRRLRRFSALDLPRAAVWQAGCAAYLEEYIDGMEDGLRREAPGLYLRPRFSPGYGDLDISHQRAMFDLLELEKRLGLSLTQTQMMLPEKSVTAIAGLSDVPGARVGDCAACAKTDCPNRRKDT